MVIQSKQQIREQQMLALKDFLGNPDAATVMDRLYQSLFSDPDFKQANTVGVTLSMAGEVSTAPIIAAVQSTHRQVVVPRTLPHRQMEFVRLDDRTNLKATKFGTREPVGGHVVAKSAIDVLIVPGLAFTRDHYRIGFGGGYYDRFLTGFTGCSIALATPPQIFDQPNWQIEPFDQQIDKIIF
ncbi:5-formyltetrahydrofolate cyclo-ligase [Lentilactobacillus parafarraginis]|jgi:5-formyltetrahydrofolate cyclo-ligase|uniref:5-formyltetrahydrofolate cyclo-ligase n=2 Tax=Lentilactobacillus parafarraginis TaxID=390842 RepID=A0A0R1YQY7_9LACO|nr:5-formyltetrahydrofolate cyclo-ligase [Lentilactobacillus parafarraginis]KRM44840.1 5-formyltetrahydrofolate cyclo-ligase [Lentilactobacillus parafarraginis DSM 18390 = JCM 14109]TLQ20621.1 5-formyltetrahydrofolate cyclo-ligase [Lentilactobacillus parafarraginis]